MIEFYSARANPYYLIFVNKLNNIYQRYYLTNKKEVIANKWLIMFSFFNNLFSYLELLLIP